MTADKAITRAEDVVTLDDLKQKAARIGDLAQAEFRRQTEEQWARNVAVAAVAVGLAIGLAFYFGTRRAPSCPPQPPHPPQY